VHLVDFFATLAFCAFEDYDTAEEIISNLFLALDKFLTPSA
jgi:hypothetical protein